MHEFSLMTSVLEMAEDSARQAHATRILRIKLVIGAMSEVLPEAMEFAHEALSPGTLAEGSLLEMELREPRSRCLECGAEFAHDRYHRACPECDSLVTELLGGRELYIDSIEVENVVNAG
jgi:hydrogenase nickel incorporation protein HypA/HybF